MSAPAVSSAPPPRPEAPPITLVAPDWNALDTLVRGDAPPVLWSVGNVTLVAHWLDHAVRRGCREAVIYCPDRPAAVRAALEGGAFWSLKLDIRPSAPPPGIACEVMDRLPGEPAPAAQPGSPGELVRWWLDLNLRWLAARDGATVQIDAAREPGGWIGPRARLSPGVVLKPPYWIGAGTFVGPGCEIGPGALVGPGCVLSGDVRVQDSFVMEGTFVGAHTELRRKLLRGGSLFDADKGVRVEITDDFVAAAMDRAALAVPAGERLLAALLWLPAAVVALFCGRAESAEVLLPGGGRLPLATRPRGPLLARRAAWLSAVVAGRMRLVGPLPRATLAAQLPEETRGLLASTTPGVFALADMHGVHDSQDPEETAHALYQAAIPAADAEVRGALCGLLFKRPGT